MGNMLSYEIIIPIEWSAINPNTIWNLIIQELSLLILGGEQFHEAIITINDLATMLIISHEELSWWFKVPGDIEPSPQRYVFSGDLLVEMYPELYDEYVVKQHMHVPIYPSKGSELRYTLFVPNEWLLRGTEREVSSVILQDLSRRVMDNQQIEGAEITFNGVTAVLFISNQCLSWCFIKNCDNGVNDDEYTRVNNWINPLFRQMVNVHVEHHQLVDAMKNINNNNIILIADDEGFFEKFSSDDDDD